MNHPTPVGPALDDLLTLGWSPPIMEGLGHAMRLDEAATKIDWRHTWPTKSQVPASLRSAGFQLEKGIVQDCLLVQGWLAEFCGIS